MSALSYIYTCDNTYLRRFEGRETRFIFIQYSTILPFYQNFGFTYHIKLLTNLHRIMNDGTYTVFEYL